MAVFSNHKHTLQFIVKYSDPLIVDFRASTLTYKEKKNLPKEKTLRSKYTWWTPKGSVQKE